jgi:hypothetical protein
VITATASEVKRSRSQAARLKRMWMYAAVSSARHLRGDGSSGSRGRNLGISVGDALDFYEGWLAEVGHKREGNEARTVETTMQRLRRFFAVAAKIAVGALSAASPASSTKS